MHKRARASSARLSRLACLHRSEGDDACQRSNRTLTRSYLVHRRHVLQDHYGVHRPACVLSQRASEHVHNSGILVLTRTSVCMVTGYCEEQSGVDTAVLGFNCPVLRNENTPVRGLGFTYVSGVNGNELPTVTFLLILR